MSSSSPMSLLSSVFSDQIRPNALAHGLERVSVFVLSKNGLTDPDPIRPTLFSLTSFHLFNDSTINHRPRLFTSVCCPLSTNHPRQPYFWMQNSSTNHSIPPPLSQKKTGISFMRFFLFAHLIWTRFIGFSSSSPDFSLFRLQDRQDY